MHFTLQGGRFARFDYVLQVAFNGMGRKRYETMKLEADYDKKLDELNDRDIPEGEMPKELDKLVTWAAERLEALNEPEHARDVRNVS